MTVPESRYQSWKKRVVFLLSLVALLWAIELMDVVTTKLFDWNTDNYGIHPRHWRGLAGIVLAPVLHGGFDHLAANTPFLLILGGLLLTSGLSVWWRDTLIIVVLNGVVLWLFGAVNADYIGASGVIYGYLGLLLGRGLFQRSLRDVVVAVLAFALCSGMLGGLLRWEEKVSWLGHASGFAAGLWLAWRHAPKSVSGVGV